MIAVERFNAFEDAFEAARRRMGPVKACAGNTAMTCWPSGAFYPLPLAHCSVIKDWTQKQQPQEV